MSGTRQLRVLDLFSGIGGFSLGLERAGMRTVAFCEIDPYCREVLRQRWPAVTCHEDVRNFSGVECDVIAGGFPCQDISSSGPRTGIEGQKSGLWSEYARLICDLRPSYVIVENVADLLGRGLGVVLGDLAEIGYDAEWDCVPASYFGFPQARERVWIVAYPGQSGRAPGDERIAPLSPVVRWPNHDRLGEAQHRAQACASRAFRNDDGVPRWMDRTGALGNAVIPDFAEYIGRQIIEAERLMAPHIQCNERNGE